MEDKKYFIIINNESCQKFLLSFKDWLENDTPDGYTKVSTTIPFPEEYWDSVKNLQIYKYDKTE